MEVERYLNKNKFWRIKEEETDFEIENQLHLTMLWEEKTADSP